MSKLILPMMDIKARWTGPLACVDEAAEDRHGPTWNAVLSVYLKTGKPEGLSSEGVMVTLRPLSVAEEDAAEVEAGPSIPLAGFVYRHMKNANVDLADQEAVARATARLCDEDAQALHAHEIRTTKLRRARVRRALVAGDFVPEGMTPAEAVDLIAPEQRAVVVLELSSHLDRLSVLSALGKAPAGQE